MTIVQALKKEGGVYRFGKRELLWDKDCGEWRVRQPGYRCQLCITPDQKTAVDFLLGKR